MTADPFNMRSLAKLYGTRDGYEGKFRPPIIEVHEPAKLLEINRANSGVNIKLSDNFGERIEHITARDDHRLTVLGADDRARIQSALTAIAQTSRGASNG